MAVGWLKSVTCSAEMATGDATPSSGLAPPKAPDFSAAPGSTAFAPFPQRPQAPAASAHGTRALSPTGPLPYATGLRMHAIGLLLYATRLPTIRLAGSETCKGRPPREVRDAAAPPPEFGSGRCDGPPPGCRAECGRESHPSTGRSARRPGLCQGLGDLGLPRSPPRAHPCSPM
jgi:hypothetical protein